MVRTKCFVGNLSFNTKENELAKEFEAAGKVISANIITRGPRSLGYGFVEMDSEADAENAVKLLDKKEVDGRPINVEVAKPREEGADAANAQGQSGQSSTRGARRGGRGGATRGAPRGARGGNVGGNANANANNGQQQTQQQGNGSRRRRDDEAEEGQNQGAARGGRRGSSNANTTGTATRGTRAARPPRTPRPEGEDTRTPSKSTLFVANLPFALEDDAFGKLIKDNSLNFKTAHVVKKKTGRSKGFGFIEFDTESDQVKALNTLNGKDINGREIVVKIALTELKTPEDVTNAQVKTETTTTASPAVTEKKDEKAATPKQEKK